MTISRRALLGTTLGAPFAATLPPLAAPALAQSAWPNRPVRVIVPWPPGGSTDVLARLISEQLSQKLGQPFVVENRPGAGGNIGADAIAKSTPDGYTMGPVTVGGWSINQYLYARLPYDPEKDIAPISMHWELPNVLVVPTAHVPATNLRDFITWAKAKQGGVNYGSPGVGTTPHLSGAMFTNRLGIEGVHVPFRGAAQTIPALLGGDVNFALDNLASYVPVITAGQMRALAVTSAERWPTLPDVPTMAEAGVPDFVVTSWCAMAFPAGVPAAITQRASTAIKEVSETPAMQDRFLRTGARAIWSTPEEAAARAARERPMWRETVRISGARLE
ncbi:Bug family tripartite tricarboxylate transporter substrate binding protein [Falsiroseomonas tokyonensis]|uniref:Bug family tripartite tricarboxylate transporter substrate binding protein n=1 Tax=Falsiroseomonas tokyonensis TaxID=430521 RepID=A0ABV7BPE3_9PROT|nr:tripartite tricarboxylate transporter substrate binding protein [Falsiroseomonas tokyonensis]MBU8536347.1 tripartite tricarboxylate transporter substrate binding protein [Falsiroseomonas tokyonensis]